jgi:hypothetical protein
MYAMEAYIQAFLARDPYTTPTVRITLQRLAADSYSAARAYRDAALTRD